MKIAKRHSHKRGEEILSAEKAALLTEIETAIDAIQADACLTKLSKEKSKQRKWAGLLLSPQTINIYFKQLLLEPHGWLTWDATSQQYKQPRLRFKSDTTLRGADRYREMDGIKNRVGIEIQFGKYAFMGYDVFSKMIIFKNAEQIDYGVEIVATQAMIDCMSTGVSAFEHLMIDFEHRGEADIDIPVLVLGIEPTQAEWDRIHAMQRLYQQDPQAARAQYPQIGSSSLKGSLPGPK